MKTLKEINNLILEHTAYNPLRTLTEHLNDKGYFMRRGGGKLIPITVDNIVTSLEKPVYDEYIRKAIMIWAEQKGVYSFIFHSELGNLNISLSTIAKENQSLICSKTIKGVMNSIVKNVISTEDVSINPDYISHITNDIPKEELLFHNELINFIEAPAEYFKSEYSMVKVNANITY